MPAAEKAAEIEGSILAATDKATVPTAKSVRSVKAKNSVDSDA
jgi:hypothetical protein